MTLYHVLDEINAIPKELWKDMPLYKSSRVMLSHNVKLLPEEYDKQIARAYKSKEAFDYIKSIAHKISFDYIQNENDPIQSTYTVMYRTVQKHSSSLIEYEWNKNRNAVAKYKPRAVDIEKLQDKRDALRTQSMLEIAINVETTISELEAIRTKIRNNSLTQRDLGNVYYTYLCLIQKNKKLKNKLPKE